jgi:predicted ester cyclase
MSREEEQRNKDLVTAFVKATNKLELDKLDDMVVEDYRENEPIPGQPPGREGLKWAYRTFNEPFPDLVFDFADVIAEGDLVVGRGIGEGHNTAPFMGIPATGKKVKWSGTRLFRIADGKLVEGWINLDMLGLMQQLGVIPTPPAGPEPAPAKHLTGKPSTREANHALMRRFIEEVWNKGNTALAEEIFHPEATSPSAPALPPGAAGVNFIVNTFRNAFPDYHMEITHLVAEDDRVAARFVQSGTHKGDLMGIPPTGKKATWTEIGILRIADGKVVESWYDVDMLGMMGQLGVGGSGGGDGQGATPEPAAAGAER